MNVGLYWGWLDYTVRTYLKWKDLYLGLRVLVDQIVEKRYLVYNNDFFTHLYSVPSIFLWKSSESKLQTPNLVE